MAVLFKNRAAIEDEERRRIACDIHDHLGQEMTALRMHLELLRAECEVHPLLHERVARTERVAEQLDQAIDRLTRSLRPPAIDRCGFARALEMLVREWSERFGIAADYAASNLEALQLPTDVATGLYWIVQEALHNVVKHARAQCVSVTVTRQHHRTVLVIADDGQGFDSGVTPTDEGALGLISMRQRAASAGCELEIESSPGRGTTIYVRLPAGAYGD
jgi:signal transduction histidine kinase